MKTPKGIQVKDKTLINEVALLMQAIKSLSDKVDALSAEVAKTNKHFAIGQQPPQMKILQFRQEAKRKAKAIFDKEARKRGEQHA